MEPPCKEVSSRSGVLVEFTHKNVPTVPSDIAINLFRVLQEALSNAVKHSGASRVEVLLREIDDYLELAVRDDGKGFDTEGTVTTSGLGLVSMRERLTLVNGRVGIQSTLGRGTTVLAKVVLTPPQDAEIVRPHE